MQRYVKVDWLSFTTRRQLVDVLELFKYLENPLKVQEKGRNGYTFSFSSSDGVVIAFTPDRPDIHVNLSGSACDIGLYKLLKLYDTEDAITRLDIAMDCVNSGFACSEIWGFLRQGYYFSVSHDIREYKGLLPEQGHTIYIGSKASERMVRIYDKGAESKKNIDWVRYEIQLRGKSSTAFALKLKENPDSFSTMYFSLLNKQIRLTSEKVDVADTNRHKMPMNEKWAEITNYAVPVSLDVGPRTKATTCSVMKHVKNCASSLKTLEIGMVDYHEFLSSIMADATLKDKHIKVIDELHELKNPTM